MNNNDFKLQVVKDLGGIQVEIQNLHKKVDAINSGLEKTKERVAKHDVIFGKVGVILTTGIFVIATGISFVIDLMKNKFLKQ